MSIVNTFRISEDRTQLEVNIQATPGRFLQSLQLYHHDDPVHTKTISLDAAAEYSGTVDPVIADSTTDLGLLYGLITETDDNQNTYTTLVADYVLRAALFSWTMQTLEEVFADNNALDEIYADQRDDILLYQSLAHALDTCLELQDQPDANMVFDRLHDKFGEL